MILQIVKKWGKRTDNGVEALILKDREAFTYASDMLLADF